MAKFLNTSGTNYFLEELIKDAKDRVILISPYLKLNDRIRELLVDKDRLKIDVRIVYGKSELQSTEMEWLHSLPYVRTSFCKNLHAKCYLSEDLCILTSMNLYEFSQVNNNEMGVLIRRSEDAQLYQDAYEEAQRIVRVSDEVCISLERVRNGPEIAAKDGTDAEKLTTSKLGQKLGMRAAQVLERAASAGYVEALGNNKYGPTARGEQAGLEYIAKSRYGPYFLWPLDVQLSQENAK